MKFIEDLHEMETGDLQRFRSGLRVRSLQADPGKYEMTWAGNGRAVFSWGTQQRPGLRHVVWLGIGGHEILP